jgi:RNA polymerase sigma factor (TIGR02999 family)
VADVAQALSLTEQLRAFSAGDRAVAEAVLRVILPKLRQIAVRQLSRERYLSPLSPTELINETWLRQMHRGGWNIQNREHYYCIAGFAMRRVLVEFARNRLALKRGGMEVPSSLSMHVADPADARRAEQVIEIGLYMEKLGREDPLCMRVVDLHYFVGFTFGEIAKILDLRPRQVRDVWEKARDWLRDQMSLR